MCGTCGCTRQERQEQQERFEKIKRELASGSKIQMKHDILDKNNRIASKNREWFESNGVLALNLVSSPGAGKTTLLERTISELSAHLTFSVIEGDQETENDARRIRATGCSAVQINTGTGCHLDADMVSRGLDELKPAVSSVVMIENVGNLVCPALFDLGEDAKIAIASVTEGEDKPLKYPHLFKASTLMLLNKIDLLPHLSFDVDRCISYARQVNPSIEILRLSAISGEGIHDWYAWLRNCIASKRSCQPYNRSVKQMMRRL